MLFTARHTPPTLFFAENTTLTPYLAATLSLWKNPCMYGIAEFFFSLLASFVISIIKENEIRRGGRKKPRDRENFGGPVRAWVLS